MQNNWSDYLARKNSAITNFRIWRAKQGHDPRHLLMSDRKLLNFTANDYLGLCGHPLIIAAIDSALTRYGTGSCGAPSLSGYSEEHYQLTEELCQWLNYEDGLLFSSGYQLNVGLFAPLIGATTQVWLPRNAHASHIDGILLAKAKFTRFNEDEIDKIAAKIAKDKTIRHLIISEGIFSMDGTTQSLDLLIKLKQQYPKQVLLIIDDAHGIGAYGFHGRGILETISATPQDIDLLIGTCGKAFATHGGFLLGKRDIIQYLRQTLRSQIFSTMLPPYIAAATRKSLQIIQSPAGMELRAKLQANITRFKQLATNLSVLNPATNDSAIQLIMLENHAQLTTIHNYLLGKNILVGKIAYPTVAKNSPRLRISLSSAHQIEDIEQLVAGISEVIQ